LAGFDVVVLPAVVLDLPLPGTVVVVPVGVEVCVFGRT
jgi:hypothetical protein